jgi:hypothetical protein
MCDPQIRTGQVPGLALCLLTGLGFKDLCWKMYLASSSCSFAKKQIATMSKALLLYGCLEESPWTGLRHTLKRAIQTESPMDILDELCDLDWPKILQGNACVRMEPNEAYDMEIFKWLHRCVCQSCVGPYKGQDLSTGAVGFVTSNNSSK